MRSLWRWHLGTSKEKQILSPWPARRSPSWVDYVNEPQSESELNAIRKNVKRGCPLGDEKWSLNIVARLGLESTLRPHGRPKKRFLTPLFSPTFVFTSVREDEESNRDRLER